ncbi:glutamate ABC transporter substrate-binding protein [Streptomyces sp. Root369]|uniref:glutamate ABC transporter substrate-binding protein n=1 Tax=Streptomyces sp. Root369 TaxID=1736523 RepID=UPI000710F862|nr:glutamate ABC transporter substrate-binding protein [Streptomyces sp. Root369]KQV93515.1 glutamate ABC transporter [Streptomyces sp. Root369]
MPPARNRTAAASIAVLALILTDCGNAGSSESSDVGIKATDKPTFTVGGRMQKLADAGKITIGVKFDQPGVGFKGATDKMPVGFDPEIAKILAASLGIAPEKIAWKETISDNREPFLENGEVDLVVASYSITDERRKVVGQAGPYYTTGQQLLVRSDSKIDSLADVKGKEVCSVTGSTSLNQIEAKGAKPRGFDTFSECVDQVLNGTVDAMTTDGALLLGYAAQHKGQLKVVVKPFSDERWGVGYSRKHPEMCQWITDTLTKAEKDGTWKKAFETTLGKSGVQTPTPPAPDACLAS